MVLAFSHHSVTKKRYKNLSCDIFLFSKKERKFKQNNFPFSFDFKFQKRKKKFSFSLCGIKSESKKKLSEKPTRIYDNLNIYLLDFKLLLCIRNRIIIGLKATKIK